VKVSFSHGSEICTNLPKKTALIDREENQEGDLSLRLEVP
jgi:hypothetical protein